MISIEDRILYRLRGKGRGWAFSARDFLDLGGRGAIDLALSRLANRGHIRRIQRGIYDFPKQHPNLGPLSPSIDSVARLIARKTNSSLKITGAEAANALGLTTQVPAQIIYLTDGPTRKFHFGNQILELRHTSPRAMATAGKGSGTIIQALQYFGKDGVTDKMIDKIRSVVSHVDKKELKKDINAAPDWLRPILLHVAD
ncbi:MAG: DUF6088 family protein [Pyrinomonadaceae bacterium]